MKDRCLGFIELRDMNTEWRDVLHHAVCRSYNKGERINHNQHLFFLDKGLIRLTHNTRDGKEKILWYIGSGCVFGETPFFDPLDCPGESIHICAMDCVVYIFSRECVLKTVFTQYPELSLNLLHSLARKVRMLSNHASSLFVDDVAIRLCKFLGQRIVPGSEPPLARLNISRQEMASLLGMHRITLFKVLKQLEDCGLLCSKGRGDFVVGRPEEFFRLMNA